MITNPTNYSTPVVNQPDAVSGPIEKIEGQLQNSFQDFMESWDSSEKKVEQNVKKVGKDFQELFNLQLEVHKLSLKTHLVSRVGDAVSSTIRRVQQMGAS